MASAMEALREHLGEISDINLANSVLGWDQQCYMPEGGGQQRAEQISTLSRLGHSKFIGPDTEPLLDAAQPEVEAQGIDGDDYAIVRITRDDYTREVKLPNDFVAARTRDEIISNEAWRAARPANDFKSFLPHLEKMVEYARKTADLLGFEDHPYDALLDLYEPGMKTAEVQGIFDVLRPAQVKLLKAIAEKPAPRSDFLERDYPEAGQAKIGLKVVQDYGYDMTRGRLDTAPHPFETDFGRDDVRITTRYDRHMPQQAIFGIFHEAGHGMYEQNVAPVFARTPLDSGCSMVFHESQSRMWENVVGRSRAVWDHYFPLMQDTFPEQLSDVTAEEFHRAINRVRPSLIRVEADEVSYNLHIMLRFELELGLVTGEIKAADLPEIWRAKMQEYVGIAPTDDRDGVMQDTHWSSGSIGYFPTYALGNVMGAQIFNSAVSAHPEIPNEMGQGKFDTLRGWLVENLYQHGRKYLPKELALKVNGTPLEPTPYLAYLQGKFGELYGVGEG